MADMPPLAPRRLAARLGATAVSASGPDAMPALPLLELALYALKLVTQVSVLALLLLELCPQLRFLAFQPLELGVEIHNHKITITSGQRCLPN
jgi:hypothetical protein